MAKGDSYAASQLFMGLTPKNGYKASKLYCYKPTDGSGDFTWSRNLTAYRKNQSGVLELMGNNVPRIDYTNTCPELLIEGERENLLTYSEQFDNADWIKINTTITANNIISPNGLLTADKIEATLSSNAIYQSITSSGDLCLSVYAKKGTSDYFFMEIFDISPAVDYIAIFNLANGTYVGNGGFSNVDSYKIEFVGDGWYKIQIVKNVGASGSHNFIIGVAQSGNLATAVPNTNIYIWGAQLEEGFYSTSYIPTTTASVTRPQDTNSSDIAFTGDGFSYNLRVRLENRSDSGTPDNIFFIEDISGTSDTYAGIYVLGDSLYFTFYNNPDIEEYSITLPDGIHNLGVSLDCNTGAYEIVVDGVSEFSGALTNGFNSANIYERVKLGCLAASTDSIGLNRIIGLQVYDAVLTQGELIEYTS
jgi:hypothetical protein